jgi:hypothetical protein
MKKIKIVLVALVLTVGFAFQSCSSSDDSSSGGGDCPNLASQVAEGNFRGTAFTSPGGVYKDISFGGDPLWRIDLYVKDRTGGSCFFPEFEGTQDIILFAISSLEPQTITFSAIGQNTLNFNRIVGNVTEVELATCGSVEITSYNADTGELQGNIVARGQNGSVVNGNFTLALCE